MSENERDLNFEENDEPQEIISPISVENVQSLLPQINDDEKYRKLVDALQSEQPALAKWLSLTFKEGKFSSHEKQIGVMVGVVFYNAIKSHLEKEKLSAEEN